MALKTPFFPGFHRCLFGSPPRAALDQARALRAAALSSANQLRTACERWIPAALLPFSSSGLNSRQRLFAPLDTFWIFLAQVLASSSCRDALRNFQAQAQPSRSAALPNSTQSSAYCQARQRLPQAALYKVQAHLAKQLQRECSQDALWQGRAVRLIDATTLSMPDTALNTAIWPHQPNQKPGCGFPIIRMAGLFCLASGALLRTTFDELECSEQVLARRLWPFLQKGEILLADRAFCSYFDLHQILSRGADAVLRLHGTRRADFRQGKCLGPQDRLVQWIKPVGRRPERSAAESNGIPRPETLTVRLVRYQIVTPGFRSREVVLATTLLDPVAFPVAALVELYRQRWQIELHWRECKTQLQLDILRCKSPVMIAKELSLHAIAYNLVRSMMQRAANLHHVALPRISFQGTVDTLQRFAQAIHAAKRPALRAQLFEKCLEIIARDLLPSRPNRLEPRVLKRRPKGYLRLIIPRAEMRARLLRANSERVRRGR